MKIEQIKKINLDSTEFEVLKEKIKSTGSKISAGSLINGLTNNCITEPQLQWLNENGNNISVGAIVEYSNNKILKVLLRERAHGKDNFTCKQLVVATDSDDEEHGRVKKTTKNQTSVILNRIYNGEKVARFLAWRPEEKDHCVVGKNYDDSLEEIDSSIIRLLTELEAEKLAKIND